MITKSKILFFLLLPILVIAQPEKQEFIYFEKADLNELRSTSGKVFDEYTSKVVDLADDYLSEEPVSIRTAPAPIEVAEPGDYYSESPYWWPIPGDPKAPYFRKDGERNPERFLDHKILLAKSYQAIASLSGAAFITGEKKYAEKALEYINNWFVNPQTRMNPHLKYAQLIKNRNRLRGVGIIETHRFTHFVEIINLLTGSGLVEKQQLAGFDDWMKEYLDWLLKSEYGIDEKQRGNNHSSWYAAQIAAISLYLRMYDIVLEQQDYVKHFLIDNQFTSSCSQPKEEARTKSLSYSCFNLDAQTKIAICDKRLGVDTWKYVNKNGCSLEHAANRIIPFILNPDSWEGEQIQKMRVQPRNFVGLAGLNFNDKSLLKAHYALQLHGRSERANYNIDPFEIILDAVVYNRINTEGMNE